MFQCLIQFRDGQSVLPPPGLRLHTPHDSFKAIREVFLQPTHTHTHTHTHSSQVTLFTHLFQVYFSYSALSLFFLLHHYLLSFRSHDDF